MAGLTKVKGSGLATGAATASLVGIDDNATSTAITIDASENVALTSDLTVKASTTTGIKAEAAGNLTHYNDATPIVTAHRQQWSSVYTATEIVSTLNGAAGELSFKTAANWTNSNATERMKITSDGYVRLAGAGIQFNGDTAAANALDDYEEGVHICVVTSDTGTITLAGDNDLGYVKIGNIVHVSGRLNVSSVSSPTGIIRWSLPFTSWAGAGRSGDSVGTVQLYRMDITSAPATMSFYLPEGTSNGYVTSTIDDGFWDTSDISPDAGDIIVFSITYRTA